MVAKHKTTKKQGRPPVEYSEGVVALLDSYEGCGTVTDMCEYLGITNVKFYQWLKDHEEFLAAVQRARDFTDDAVENAMLKRALGFEYTEQTEKAEDGEKDGSSKTASITRKVYVPGDVGAQKNWLSNRRPDRWRETKTVKIEGNYHEMLAKFASEEDGGEDSA